MSFRLKGEEKQEKTSKLSSPLADSSSKLGSLSEFTESTASVRERLQSILPQGENVFQRCVIVQKDEYGYGLTVSGENPVFVDSIKPGGAAQQAGVREGDMIVKVNGNLVAKANHKEVVKLIKSGTYVSLTLISRQARTDDSANTLSTSPSTSTNSASVTATTPVSSTPISTPSSAPSHITADGHRQSLTSSSLAYPNFITGPTPVNSEKNMEFNRQKLTTMREMLQQAKMDYNRLKNEYELQPCEKLYVQLTDKGKIVQNLEGQLRALESGIHSGHKRSQSDLTGIRVEPTPVRHEAEDSDHDQVESMNTSESASSLASPQNLDDTDNSVSPVLPILSPLPIHAPLQPKTHSLGSSDSINVRLGSSPPRNPGIITMEDDEFESEDEHQFENHGHFTSLQRLMKHPAHLSVFLSYLINNQDPSPMFFYIFTESYNQGNTKEMRKWAYEIHSTFISEKAPLRLNLDEDLVSCVEHVLMAKYDKEDTLKSVFDDIRSLIKIQISKLLQDYCNTRSLGLGSIYGEHEVQDLDYSDRAAVVRFIDKSMFNHLEQFLEKEEQTDRNMALAMCVGSFMKSNGVPRTQYNQRLMDRTSSFNEKDKRMFKFPKGGKKTQILNSHSLEAQHYYYSTFCNMCGGLLWGVGYQGFQCTTCELNFHKHCLDNLKDHCSGQAPYKPKKDKGKRTSVLEKIITRKPSNNSPTAIREAQINFDQGLVSPSGTSGFHLQETVPEDPEPDDKSAPSRVGKLVDRYQKMNKDDKPPEESTSDSDKEKRSSPVGRSESMKGRQKEKISSGSVRRTKSDVANDDGSVMQAISDQTVASSSSSSLSTKSASPSMSLEHMNRIMQFDSDFEVENELPPLDSILTPGTLKKLKPKEKKRQDVINELFYTERSHLRNLKILDQVFYQPWLSDPSLPKKLVHQLLPNIGDLIRLHSTINRAMKIARPKDGKPFGDIADIMLDYFSGEKGEQFKKACSIYCRNHRYALDQLKAKLKKDQKLAQFLQEAEANPLCRRLKLTDLIPMQMQRLTKYRLLVENMMKYTHSNSGESRRLQKVLAETKDILAVVNQAVTDCENAHKLESLQKRIEKKSEINNDQQAKNLDLTEHKLLYDGTLMLKDGKSKITECHVILLEDILVVLQKQDEKLILKPLSIKTMGPVRPDDSVRFSSPVIPLVGLLTRNVATDKKAFFLVSISADSRIFELTANTVDERDKWYKYISQASEAATKSSGSILRIPQPQPKPQPRVDEKKEVKQEDGDHREETPGKKFIHFETQESTQPASPWDVIQRTDRIIANALQEKQRVIAEILGMPPGEFENIAEIANSLGHEKEPNELIVAAILQANRLTTLAKEALKPPESKEGDNEEEEEEKPDHEPESATATPSLPTTVHLPVNVLLEVVTTLNQDLSQLLRITNDKETELNKVKQDLKSAQDQVKIFHDVSMSMGAHSPGNSRPQSLISVTGSELSEESSDEQTLDQDACSTPKRASYRTPRQSLSSSIDEDGQITPLVQDNLPPFDLSGGTLRQDTLSSCEQESSTEQTLTDDIVKSVEHEQKIDESSAEHEKNEPESAAEETNADDDKHENEADIHEDAADTDLNTSGGFETLDEHLDALYLENEVERGESDTSLERVELAGLDLSVIRGGGDVVSSDPPAADKKMDENDDVEETEKNESDICVSKIEIKISDENSNRSVKDDEVEVIDMESGFVDKDDTKDDEKSVDANNVDVRTDSHGPTTEEDECDGIHVVEDYFDKDNENTC